MPDLFEEKSSDWDANDMIRGLSSAIGSSILDNVSLHDEMCVMDFGAGTGLICAHIAPHVKKVVAVDISEAMLDKLACKPELQDKVEALCQDIIDTPIDETFDLIVSAMAMHHVEDTSRLLQRFSEHLASGAMVALADLDKEEGSFHPEGTEGVFHSGFDRNELKELLAEKGFSDIQFVTAHTVNKETGDYPVFLVVASKK